MATGPDSLRAMPLLLRYGAIDWHYTSALKRDTSQAKRLVRDLEQFFDEKGSEADQLTFRIWVFRKGLTGPKTYEQLAAGALQFLKEAEQIREPYLTAFLHHWLGMLYYNHLKQYGPAFRHYLRMYDLVVNFDERLYPERSYALYLVARAYYDFFDYKNTIRYGQVLMQVQEQDVKDSHIFNACMLGMAYLRLGQYEQARRHFHWSLSLVPTGMNSRYRIDAWEGILNGNIGVTYFEQKQYDQAISYLTKGIDFTRKTSLWDNFPRFSTKLALIYLERGQIRQAYTIAQQALQAAKRADEVGEYLPLSRYLAEPYKVVADCYRAMGNYEKAFRYADSARVAETQWKQQMNIALKHRAEIAIEQERFQAREQQLQQEKERQLLLRNALLALTILSLLVVLLLYNRRQLKDRHRRQQLQAEKQLAEAELQSAQALLNQLRQGVQQKSRLIDQYEAEFSVSADGPAIGSNQYQLLNDLRHSVILTDDDWHQFVDVFEKVHPGFFYRLKTQLPDLTPAETRFMALSRLSYTAREMAHMLGVSPGAVRQYRHTIRCKLDLPDEVSVDEIAQRV
ncbi:hypothetical protein GCM10023187_14840 [Nibrella viscosa]|uniref:Tetratricopeptide repeat-containing protein n=2 Tax=Nibrella viscosa TaxID=1084524 RepID=A0ABP8K5S8_9BACT